MNVWDLQDDAEEEQAEEDVVAFNNPGVNAKSSIWDRHDWEHNS